MKRASLALLALVVAACGGRSDSPSAPSETPAPAAPRPSVVIISVDGLRPDAIDGAGAASILSVAQRGAFTWGARTVSPSETLPAHASMISGQPPEVHGMTWDDYEPGRGRIPVPTIFGIARSAGLRTAMVASKSKFFHFEVPGSLDALSITGAGDAAVADEAIARARQGFDLMLVHFSDVDLAGHERGWMSRAYLDKVLAGRSAGCSPRCRPTRPSSSPPTMAGTAATTPRRRPRIAPCPG
jgi:predicted AlkP superfamily pyrophosphatase or phosphodiesterase